MTIGYDVSIESASDEAQHRHSYRLQFYDDRVLFGAAESFVPFFKKSLK
jgi:hypothetical protein